MQIKTTNDYVESLCEKFPGVSKNDIKRIINFGWRSFYQHNSYGGDVFIKDNDLWCYVGSLKKDSIKFFKYYIKKLSIKIRILYRRKKIEWDGYYYFALDDNLYNNYISLKKKRGRPKKNFKFENIALYLILDECKISESGKKFIFRIPYITYVKYKFFLKELITDKAELIIERSPLKFEDILINYNEYEFI